MGLRKSFTWRCSGIALALCALNGIYLTYNIGGLKRLSVRNGNRSMIERRGFDYLVWPFSTANLTTWFSSPMLTEKTPLIVITTPRPKQYHTVTYASHHGSDERFCMALESAARQGMRLTILGWGVPWRGLFQKLEAAMEFADSLPPDDVVLFVDAFDVLFTNASSQAPPLHLSDRCTQHQQQTCCRQS